MRSLRAGRAFFYLGIPEAYSQVQHIMLNIYMSHKAFNLIDIGRNQELTYSSLYHITE